MSIEPSLKINRVKDYTCPPNRVYVRETGYEEYEVKAGRRLDWLEAVDCVTKFKEGLRKSGQVIEVAKRREP